MTRKFLGDMTRKLSVTESQNRAQFLKLPVNRFDLADYLGTVTKSSERAFARLESQGFIRRVTSRTIKGGLNACNANSGAVIPDASRERTERPLRELSV